MSKQTKRKYPMWKSIRYMLDLAWKYEKSVIFMCLILAVLRIGLNLAQLFIAPEILRRVENTAPLGELVGTIGVFTGVIFLLSVLNRYLGDSVLHARVYIRSQIIHQINYKGFTTAYSNCDDPRMKWLQGQANDETGGNRESTEHIWTVLTELLINLGGLVIYLAMLTHVSWGLIAMTVATCFLSFLAKQKHIQWQNDHQEESGTYWRQYSYLEVKTESVSTAKDIRIFGLSPWIRELYEGVLDLHRGFVERRERTYLASAFVDVGMTFLRNGAAYAYLLYQVLEQGMPASAFLLYFSAVSGFTAWFGGVLDRLIELYRQTQGIGTVLEYLSFPEPFRFEGGSPIPQASSWELRLEDVSFRYPGAEKNFFEHLNLTIHPGEKLAVVGLNGAGKTTLVKLLCGFYDPNEGKVTLNGIDIREFNRREYYGLLCAVYQDFSVLDVTVGENVAQTAKGIDEARVWQCLDQAGLADFVRQLPRGLDTHVGRDVYLDGVLFSGGQTQRLMLARALYKGGPILVLDEPTAALDPIAESEIYQKYDQMTEGKTSLFISHRLASTRFCDRIIFLADGAIAEEGTHTELLTLGGAYAKLFEVQSRYYQEGVNFRDQVE